MGTPPQITTMVVVICVPYTPIGPTRPPPLYKEYRLHPSDLSAPYFQEQLRHPNPSRNASVRVLSLLDTNVHHFDIYEAWLREDEISTSSELEEQTQSSLAMSLGRGLGVLKKKPPKTVTAEQERTNYDNLLGCYNLGSVLDDRRFQDAVTSKLIQLLRSPLSRQSQLIRLLTCERIKYIADRHSTSSPLYRLLVTAYARFASVNEIRALAFSDYINHFKFSVLQAMAGLRTKQHIDGNGASDFVAGECNYHSHGFYEPCTLRRS